MQGIAMAAAVPQSIVLPGENFSLSIEWANYGPANAVGLSSAVRLGAFVGSRGHSSDRQDLLAAVTRASESGEFRMDTYGSVGLPLVHPMWLLKGLASHLHF
jgi:hypothetical protein